MLSLRYMQVLKTMLSAAAASGRDSRYKRLKARKPAFLEQVTKAKSGKLG